MSKVSRTLLICASSAFGLCCVGLLAGLIYTLVEYFRKRQAIEYILGGSLPFYKTIGVLGILGFLLFFVFLISLLIRPAKRDKT